MLSETGQHRRLQIQELEELRDDAYENASIFKNKLKAHHDKHLIPKKFSVGQKVLLYKSRLRKFAGKLKSKWTGSYIITTIFEHGAVEIHGPDGSEPFKVNGHRIKPFYEGFKPTTTEAVMVGDPPDQP